MNTRITELDITNKIKDVEYVRVSNTTITFCILTLENGFTVTGESACVDPANFSSEIGNRIAYQNAFDKIWQLEGYLLKQRMYEGRVTSG